MGGKGKRNISDPKWAFSDQPMVADAQRLNGRRRKMQRV